MSAFKQKLVVLGVVAFGALGAIAVLRTSPHPTAEPASSDSDDSVDGKARDPRQVLSRPWFDHYPKSRTEDVDIWWFSGAGIGMHERGSYWRSSMDFFDFERQTSRLNVVFLHDKQKQSVRFEIVKCDDAPPFDLCLDVKEPLRGKKRFYSFIYGDEMDKQIPWSKEWRVSAEARTRGAR